MPLRNRPERADLVERRDSLAIPSALAGFGIGAGLWAAAGLVLAGYRADATGGAPGTAEQLLLWGGLVLGIACFVAGLVLIGTQPRRSRSTARLRNGNDRAT
ncbi:MAG: hypothetical protein PGN07_03640 [Aeromicrobium erythreum]